MPRPIEAIINLAALAQNLEVMRKAAPDSKVWAVVKANGYGHGIEHIYPALHGADGIALLDLNEAQRVRDLGWRKPILLLEGVFESRDLELCSSLNLTHTIHTTEQLEMLARHKTLHPHHIYLKLNTGMNRLGFHRDAYPAVWNRLNGLPQVGEITLMTHFGSADQIQGIKEPLDCFIRCTQDLPGEKSFSNSAAILRYAPSQIAALKHQNPDAAFTYLSSDWVRTGIALYGSSPDYPQHSIQDWGLKSVMSLRAKVISVQNLDSGDSVGYGAIYRASEAKRIGVVSCGYADGYMRVCKPDSPVLVDGERSCIVGRVSMDMLTVDLSHLPNSGIGSEVTLWGESSCGGTLSIDEPAHFAGTIGYELMTALTRRVPIKVVA